MVAPPVYPLTLTTDHGMFLMLKVFCPVFNIALTDWSGKWWW